MRYVHLVNNQYFANEFSDDVGNCMLVK